ncbi:lipoyl synthase [Thiospirillum jenense]|uniref:Lipoyl synthase n=1 Tax=Thiospirillum jenense TaxID=1653858 RepID=A0A839HEU5_9GAMM|nr:lipoyl synthase [Thiospirillum jenense]MBB1126994.1 lipoyl synthase [Thiospirillum jenense]
MTPPDDSPELIAPSRRHTQSYRRGIEKIAPLSIQFTPTTAPLRKPAWIRAPLPAGAQVAHIKTLLRTAGLATVCEEAACPNLGECFGHGTAAFMILGELCTRRCPFCDVAHGQPLLPDPAEPERLAAAIVALKLRYVVMTSVTRDDLRDGGAAHFVSCIKALRITAPEVRIEILVPDFRGRETVALTTLASSLPDVFNHNVETVARCYPLARPGADYHNSLNLLQEFKRRHPNIPTKSGLMVGLGETREELIATVTDLRQHGCEMLTIGQYLAPSRAHLPVQRYWTPDEFAELATIARELGFSHVASGALVRSSYHAEQQARYLTHSE